MRIAPMIFLLSLVLLAGCEGPRELDVYSGTSGVDINFMSSAPHRELYVGSEVMISLEAWNRGAYSLVDDDEYAIIGLNYDSLYFRGVKPEQIQGYKGVDVWLHGKSPGWPTGEREIINIGVLEVRDVPGTRERPTTTIKANICYPYTTFLTETVCVDVDVYGVDDRPVCKNRPRYSYSGQGSPVVISRVESEMLPAGTHTGREVSGLPVADPAGFLERVDRVTQDTTLMRVQPSFTIYLRNAGKGIVLTRKENQHVEEVCGERSEAISFRDINGLRVKAWLDNEELVCEPEIVSMLDGTGRARCIVPRNDSYITTTNYMASLSVEVDYFYREEISTEVRINRIR